jgi:hypothetical protein
MTRKVITVEFVVPTVLAVAMASVFSMVAVYLTETYLGPIEQAEAHYSAAGSSDWFAEFGLLQAKGRVG